MAWPDVAHLLLMGGATRMPMIGKMLEALTGLKPMANLQPDEAVARGAALRAECLLASREGRASIAQVEIVDLTSYSLGIEWSDRQTGRTENVVIISRGTQLPCATSAKIATTDDDQRTLAVQLLEGESRKALECSRIAELVIGGLPADLPKNSPIEVQYQVTADRRLQVKAHMQGSDAALAIEVRRGRGLSADQVAQWKKLLSGEVGLKAILAQLASQESQAPPLPVGEFASETMQRRADERAALPVGHAVDEQFGFDVAGVSKNVRPKNRKTTPRQIAIMLAGYVVSSVLGLAIGYYILMLFEPSYNWYHLRLPGLSREAPVSGAVPTNPR
jgi:molecular chaperone DnaK (HSP70)